MCSADALSCGGAGEEGNTVLASSPPASECLQRVPWLRSPAQASPLPALLPARLGNTAPAPGRFSPFPSSHPFSYFSLFFFFFPFPLFLGFFSAFPFPSPGTGLEASHSVCNTHHLQQINKTDLSLFGTSNLKGFCPVWPCFMPICSSPQSPLAWHLQDLSSSLSGRFCIQYFAKVPSKSISLFPVFILACWGWEMLVQKSLQHENSFLVS